MSDFSPINLSLSQKSTATASPGKREKVSFTHYGFLSVEGWCAYGLPPSMLPAERPRLVGSGALPYLESVLMNEKKSNAQLTGETKLSPAGERHSVYPKASQRVLRTWPPNGLWVDFLFDLDADVECAATRAEEQVTLFRKSMNWNATSPVL
jgi:hypothetical protein